MSQGVIQLRGLLEFIDEQHANPEAYRRKLSALGSEYGKRCKSLVESVPEECGFYLWGYYDKKEFWINVYLGMAGKKPKGKTSHLRHRLLEELGDERAFAWRAFCAKETVAGMDPKYATEVERAFRKTGSTHIFWNSTPHLEGENIEPIEDDLIETMNPTGNRKRSKPDLTLREESEKVLNSFREMINIQENRKTKYHLNYHDQFWEHVGRVVPSTP